MENEFYTVIEIAELFKVHPNTIRRAIRRGFIVAIKIGVGPRSPYRVSRKGIEAIHLSMLKDLAEKSKKKL